jgi:hypothetical protein
MEFLLGLGVVVAVVRVLGALGSSSPAAPPPRRSTAPRAAASTTVRRPVPRPAAPRRHDRERLADEAFADGVLFSHYFLHDRDAGQSSAAADDPWAADSDDEFFDDGFND